MAERALHIGVDGRELLGRTTGVGRYVREILRTWLTDPDWPHTLTIFTPSEPSVELAAALAPHVAWHVVPSPRAGTWWEQWQLPRAVSRLGVDVFFAGAYTAPLRLPCPFVVVIHDVSYFAHPEWFGAREGARRRWLTRASARRAHTVATVSEFSAREIARWVDVPRQRIVLAQQGPPTQKLPRGEPAGHMVLFAGSLFNRRLIPELIAGFSRVDVPGARLVLAGDNRTHPPVDPRNVAAAHGLSDRVEWREYVSEMELAHLYESARAFAFLSTYEGFAMTPMEALAYGVPSVLLDTPVAREIYDGAALFTSAAPDSIAAALTSLLTDDAIRHRLLAAGHDILNRYSWPQAAATIRDALERAGRLS